MGQSKKFVLFYFHHATILNGSCHPGNDTRSSQLQSFTRDVRMSHGAPFQNLLWSGMCSPCSHVGSSRQSLIASLLHLNYHKIVFVECYMKFCIDPSFCKDGWHDAASNHTVISLPTGNAFPPRASVLKEIPRKFRKLFLTQKGSDRISSVQNSKLNVKEGGGLLSTDWIPTEVHSLLFKFLNGRTFKNPAVPIVS